MLFCAAPDEQRMKKCLTIISRGECGHIREGAQKKGHQISTQRRRRRRKSKRELRESKREQERTKREEEREKARTTGRDTF